MLLQGCSLGLERLGLEAVSRRFLERLVSSRSCDLTSCGHPWKSVPHIKMLGCKHTVYECRGEKTSLSDTFLAISLLYHALVVAAIVFAWYVHRAACNFL